MQEIPQGVLVGQETSNLLLALAHAARLGQAFAYCSLTAWPLIPFHFTRDHQARTRVMIVSPEGELVATRRGVTSPQRRLLGVSGLAIEDFKLKASTNAQLTSQPKPSLMALQKMPIGQLWGGGRLVDLLRSSLSRLWMA
jgi:hypothetical protein